MLMQISETKAILDSGEFEKFVGEVEDQHFECKGAPYRLENNLQKQELAKDVAGFANADGGVIVIGLSTEKSATSFGEKVSKVRPFSSDLFSPKQYRDILRTWLYPNVTGLDIEWYPSTRDRAVGMAALIVPPQHQSLHPFLLTRYITEGEKGTEIVFGYVQRRIDEVQPYTVQNIHALMSQGISNDFVSQRLEALEALSYGVMNRLQLIQFPMEEITERGKGIVEESKEQVKQEMDKQTMFRIDQAIAEVNITDKPAYILYAYPIVKTSVPDLFAKRTSEITSLLRDPPKLRSHGFGLDTGDEPRIVAGQLRRAKSVGNSIIEFWRDGFLIFIASGGDDFLCWGRRKRIQGGMRINPIALAESVFLFCELSRRLFRHAVPISPPMNIGLSMRNLIFDNIFCGLSPYEVGSGSWEFSDNFKRPPEPKVTTEARWESGEINAPKLAFVLVSGLYEWYGFEHEVIPYTAKEGDYTIIDPKALEVL